MGKPLPRRAGSSEDSLFLQWCHSISKSLSMRSNINPICPAALMRPNLLKSSDDK